MAYSTSVTPIVCGSEESEREKKREYNRDAQRVFRQKRKDHLGKLETAQREHDIEQNEELQVLRRQNNRLVRENKVLRHARRKSHPNDIAFDIEMARPEFLLYAPREACLPTSPSVALLPASQFEAFSLAASSASDQLVFMPNNIAKIRSTLHQLFAPVLNVCGNSNPRCHLEALRSLSPSLPTSLKPTHLQLTIPHHPHIDMLPSSLLRDRLIAIGPALSKIFVEQVCTVALDIENNGQITVWGENWEDASFYEFSAHVLECWGGWLLTPEWVQRANFWRAQRGAGLLAV